MDKEGWCRPKVWRQYVFGGDQCWISCLPQQKWQFKCKEGGKVTIFSENRLINFKITEEDFKAHWLEIEVKGKYDKFATERLSHD